MVIVAQDFVGTTLIAHREGRAGQCDLIKIVCKSPLRAGSPQALQTFAQRLGNGLSLRLSRQLRHRCCELFGLFIADVQGGHFIT